jgi:hypothetical protein
LVVTAQAQTVPKSLEEGGTDAAMNARKNNWTVGVAGGQLTGTYMTFANELAEEKFVEGLFTKWDKFLEPPRHPKWRDVNLAATVPGWGRWSVADEMLKRVRPKDGTDAQVANTDFSAFLKDKSSAAANLTPEQRDALLREFLRWREKRGATQR